MSTHNHSSQTVLDNDAIVSVKSSNDGYETKHNLGLKSGDKSVLVYIKESELRKVQASIDLILGVGYE